LLLINGNVEESGGLCKLSLLTDGEIMYSRVAEMNAHFTHFKIVQWLFVFANFCICKCLYIIY